MASEEARIDNDGMTDHPVRDRLAAVPAALSAAARAASPEPPAPDEWTPSDIVRHMIAVEKEVWHPRLAQIAVENHPRWPWAEPAPWAGEPGASLERLLSIHAADRASTLAALDALGDDGWARTGSHETYGVLDVAGLMTKAIDHDEEHLRSFRR